VSAITEWIALSIAEARVKKARDALRPKLLQQAQLEGGRLIEDDEGVVSQCVECPVCAPEFDASGEEGSIHVPAPFGVEAGEMALAPEIDMGKLDPDAMLWALANGVFKLQLDSKALKVFDQSTDERARYFLPLVSKAIKPRATDVLRVLSPAKVKELR
jgi:hypothetical protein